MTLVVSSLWASVFVGRGQLKVIAWWALMGFGLLGVLVSIFVLVAVIRRVLTGQRPHPELVALLVIATLAAWPSAWFLGIGSIAYPADATRTVPAVSVRLPFDQPVLVGWGGDTLATNYHVTVPAERWAYDLLAHPITTGSEVLEDYGIYGVEVLAPASGVVVGAVGDRVDLPPGTELDSTDPREMLGNYIFLRLDSTDTYLVMAHLQEGSLQVVEGQHVAEGQVLGRVGNSGLSSEPHLHIHHQRQNPATAALLLAEGLPLFFRDTDGPAMPTGGLAVVDGEEVSVGLTVAPLP